MKRMNVGVAGVLVLAAAGAAFATDYTIAVDGTNLIAEPFLTAYIGLHCFDGSSAYCIVRGVPVATGQWGSDIVRVNNIDTTPTTTLLVSNVQWKAFLGLNPSGTECERELYNYSTILPGNRMAVIGDYLQFMDHGRQAYAPGATPPNCSTGSYATDAVYRVNKHTGQMSVFVSNDQFREFLGLEGLANSPKFNTGAIAFSSTNDMLVYEEVSHSLIQIDPEGNLRLLISRQEFRDYYGYEPPDAVSALSFDSQGRLYWALKGGFGGASGAIHRRNCDGSFVRMISQQDIWNVTSTFANSTFFDIYVGPDDRLYFYEGGSGSTFSILYFDVNDANLPHTIDNTLPAGVIKFYLTAAQLTAGPAGSKYVSSFSSRGSNLTWSTGLSAVSNDIYTKPLAGPCCQVSTCTCPWLPLADFNFDRRVTPEDFLTFTACATGPSVPYLPGALPAGCTVRPDCAGRIAPDLDADGDVDADDFAAFQRALTIQAPE